MPWTGEEFRRRHNKALSDMKARRAAALANGMLRGGVDEGVAIATANARVKGPQERHAEGLERLAKRRRGR